VEFAIILLDMIKQHYHPRTLLRRSRRLLYRHVEAYPWVRRWTLFNALKRELILTIANAPGIPAASRLYILHHVTYV
jgi:hypothetical protein